MKISAFKTDRTKESEGVWVPIGEGASLLIARMNNERYKRVFVELTKPYRTQVRTGTLSEELAAEILRKCYARAVLLDWKGLQDDDGNDISYSVEEAEEQLKIPDFMSLVEELSNARELYKREADEQAGNS